MLLFRTCDYDAVIDEEYVSAQVDYTSLETFLHTLTPINHQTSFPDMVGSGWKRCCGDHAGIIGVQPCRL
jgi:hypothetical protein